MLPEVASQRVVVARAVKDAIDKCLRTPKVRAALDYLIACSPASGFTCVHYMYITVRFTSAARSCD